MPAVPLRPFSLTVYALVATTLLLWASAFVAIRVAIRSYSPEHLALLRFLVASGALALASPFFGLRLPRWRDIPAFMGMGATGIAFYSYALNVGEQTVTAGGASLIIASETVFVAILAGIFLREHVSSLAWLGFALSMTGVALVSFGSAEGVRITAGAWWLVAAALAAGSLTVWQKAYLDRYSPIEISSYCVWAGALVLLLAWPGFTSAVRTAAVEHTAMAAYLGIGPAAIAYTVWTYALQYTKASILSAALYLVSPLTVLTGWLFLGEIPSPMAIIGGGIVLLGVWLAGRRSEH